MKSFLRLILFFAAAASGLVRAQNLGSLYQNVKASRTSTGKMQNQFALASGLFDAQYFQLAALQYVDVIRQGESKYLKPAIEKLSQAADILGDDTLLNYSISKVQLQSFPDSQKDIIYFRLGELRQKSGKYQEAPTFFDQIPSGSKLFYQAQFNKGLSYLEANQTQKAIPVFENLLQFKSKAEVNDAERVATLMALARAQYQAQNWTKSIEYYRRIPRDNPSWHEALFESSWAFFRDAQFRSALSQFQSLHSAFYEDFYIPESLILRSLVYLYICQYEEMDKVIELFFKIYTPQKNQIQRILQTNKDPQIFYQEVYQKRSRLSFALVKSLQQEGDISRSFQYIKKILAERTRAESSPWARNSLGAYARRALQTRLSNAQEGIGELIRLHLQSRLNDLNDLVEQASFAKYEMINGKKEQLKKRIAGKTLPASALDEKVSRQYYVQNGYEYWPFKGEYWLDEIGNYHYLGRQSCE